MKTKAILFDLDDTLSDSKKYIRICHTVNANKYIIGIKDDKQKKAIIDDLVWLSTKKEIKKLKDRIKYIEDKYSVKITQPIFYRYFWNRYMKKYFCLYDDAADTLKKLKERGYKIGLVSNSGYQVQYTKLELTDIKKYFDCFSISEEIKLYKPDKEIFFDSLNKLGIKPNEAVYVGDNYEKDIKGAMNASLKPIWYKGNKNNNEGITCIDTLSELLEMFK